MYYVYVLFSLKDNKLYNGYTNNLRKRYKEHQEGLVQSTKHRRPLELVYYEAHKHRKDAMEREKYFKSGWGRNYIKKILKNYLEEKRKK